MFSYNIFKNNEEILLAISDSSILGKTFEEEGMQLEVPETFYARKNCDKEEVIKLIRDATIINAVGNNIISLLIEKNIIEKEKVLTIGGVPHAQIVSIKSP